MQASSGTGTSTALLVQKARAGSQAAFGKLVDLHHGAILRMVYYRIRSRPDAEDLTQEVFIQAFKRLSGLRDDASFRSWLYRIAVNRIRDHLRKKKFRSLFVSAAGSADLHEQQPEGETDRHADALDHLARREFWQRIGSVLERFSRMEREVFLLRFFDSLSIREIGQVLRKSESTVKTHLYRGIRKFKQSPVARQLVKEVML